ncbi:MAG: SpoIVB peptidase, partial [Clostridia bacterium]|nr:SpoIVB peptidase [Clostridia bacterium]
GVLRGSGGDAGELIGVFPTDPASAIGTVTQNTPCGIAGTLHAQVQGETVPLAAAGEIALGEATMYAQVDGDDIRPYAVRVIRLDVQSSPQVNGFMIEVTDDALLALTGGIVQGMSGSPVVQGGKLIGVVTHVLLQNNRRGYCIYADLMADKLL